MIRFGPQPAKGPPATTRIDCGPFAGVRRRRQDATIPFAGAILSSGRSLRRGALCGPPRAEASARRWLRHRPPSQLTRSRAEEPAASTREKQPSALGRLRAAALAAQSATRVEACGGAPATIRSCGPPRAEASARRPLRGRCRTRVGACEGTPHAGLRGAKLWPADLL